MLTEVVKDCDPQSGRPLGYSKGQAQWSAIVERPQALMSEDLSVRTTSYIIY